MSLEHVNHRTLVKFADEKVNLKNETVKKYRDQAAGLRTKLTEYLKDHPDFSLKKMLLSGSLAKGTALRSLNDIDVACYVSGADVPGKTGDLIDYIADKLRTAYPNFSPDQVKPNTYSVTVSFRGTGLDVDVVPILYTGDLEWYGDLVSQDDGSLLRTNIPYHLDFCRNRKNKNDVHFAQVVRLVKFWARRMKQEHDGFRFKSFMIEMILAHLADNGMDFSNYPEALQGFFLYLLRTNLEERIVFGDYYDSKSVGNHAELVQIIDPVNAENNVSRLYTSFERDLIIEAAEEAGDAIDSAIYATTKADTVRYWQKVFGPAFQG